jgi:hypothetical protein
LEYTTNIDASKAEGVLQHHIYLFVDVRCSIIEAKDFGVLEVEYLGSYRILHRFDSKNSLDDASCSKGMANAAFDS